MGSAMLEDLLLRRARNSSRLQLFGTAPNPSEEKPTSKPEFRLIPFLAINTIIEFCAQLSIWML